ncbi:MAG: Phosphoserine aminotransferase, partial [uncultured Ramlibacter sp.]
GTRRPLADERAVQAQGRCAGRSLPEGRASPGNDPAQGPPVRWRHARLDLQRHAARGRQGPGCVHEGIRGPAWL